MIEGKGSDGVGGCRRLVDLSGDGDSSGDTRG